ncbi:MAG: outer membrane lipoprotein-sorting protein [Bacteroidales bacterium]|nr:outer membrane lipoprotein-sorting protein [Bacteroidales bacterium]
MKKMLFLLSAVSVLSLQVILAQQSDPVQLMDKSRDLTMSGNIQSTVSLTITEKNGAVRTRKLNMITKSYDDGTIKRMVKFLDPADVRGTAMLIVDNKNTQDDMWIYLPALKKTRRIVSSEKGKSFMSSEFSNADMSSGSNTDFKIRHMPESGKAGVWVIESVPVSEEKGDEYGFSRKITYLEMGSLKTKQIDFYNFDDELFKTIEIMATQPLTGKEGYVMTDMLAINHINGRSSRVKFDQVNTSATIADNTFVVESLAR